MMAFHLISDHFVTLIDSYEASLLNPGVARSSGFFPVFTVHSHSRYIAWISFKIGIIVTNEFGIRQKRLDAVGGIHERSSRIDIPITARFKRTTIGHRVTTIILEFWCGSKLAAIKFVIVETVSTPRTSSMIQETVTCILRNRMILGIVGTKGMS